MKAGFAIALLAISMLCVSAMAQENTADDWYKKGLEQLGRTPLEDVIKSYDRALEINPNNATYWAAKGSILGFLALTTNNTQSKYGESLDAYNKSLQLDPENPWTWDQMGSTYLQMKRYNESLEARDRAIESIDKYQGKLPVTKTEMLSSIWAGKAYTLQEAGRMNESLAAFDKALQINSGNYDAYLMKSRALKALGQNSEADAAYAKAKELGALTVNVTQENTTDYWIKKGNNLVGNGSFEEALQDYDQAILIDAQNAEAWRGKGNAQSILGQQDEGNQSLEKSLTLYDEIIKANPEDMNARLNKSMVLAALERPKEALNVLDNIIELDPKNYGALGRKAEVLSTIGMYNESINTFDKALQMIPDSATETLFSFWMSKGWTQQAHGDDEAALNAYEKGITLNPEEGSAWFFKGGALKALGRQSEADEAYARAKELGYTS